MQLCIQEQHREDLIKHQKVILHSIICLKKLVELENLSNQSSTEIMVRRRSLEQSILTADYLTKSILRKNRHYAIQKGLEKRRLWLQSELERNRKAKQQSVTKAAPAKKSSNKRSQNSKRKKPIKKLKIEDKPRVVVVEEEVRSKPEYESIHEMSKDEFLFSFQLNKVPSSQRSELSSNPFPNACQIMITLNGDNSAKVMTVKPHIENNSRTESVLCENCSKTDPDTVCRLCRMAFHTYCLKVKGDTSKNLYTICCKCSDIEEDEKRAKSIDEHQEEFVVRRKPIVFNCDSDKENGSSLLTASTVHSI